MLKVLRCHRFCNHDQLTFQLTFLKFTKRWRFHFLESRTERCVTQRDNMCNIIMFHYRTPGTGFYTCSVSICLCIPGTGNSLKQKYVSLWQCKACWRSAAPWRFWWRCVTSNFPLIAETLKVWVLWPNNCAVTRLMGRCVGEGGTVWCRVWPRFMRGRFVAQLLAVQRFRNLQLFVLHNLRTTLIILIMPWI